ncbi:MAG: metallophosphoesterase family protein [Phycisphaerales bacterium]
MKPIYFAVLSSCLFVCSTFAQPQDDTQPESENVGHTRHHHPHNPKHETTDDETRFYTDRESDVQIALPLEKDAFSFVIFGDRTGGPDEGVAILADSVRDVNLLEPDLVMTVGDLIEGYNESPDWMRQMREYRAVMDKLLCPWFPVAGNHDVYWRFKGNEQKPEGEFEGLYEMYFGPLWYSFTHKTTSLLCFSQTRATRDRRKRFNSPESQRTEPEQRSFLRAGPGSR